jgi:hypothetical protein
MNRFEKRDNSSKVTVIVLLSVLGVGFVSVLACAGLAYVFIHKAGQALGPAFQQAAEQQEANMVVQMFLNQLVLGQVEEAYRSTSNGFRARQTLAQFKKFVQDNPLLSNYDGAQPAPVNHPPGAAQMSVQYTLTGKGVLNLTFQIIKEGDEWRIDALTVP